MKALTAINQRYLIFFLLMIASILIRLPSLNRPLSKHHEFNTAFFLIPMEIWQQEGISKHGFLPPYTYPGKANKYLTEPIGIEAAQRHGTNYYFSLPPGSYWLPYGIFQALGLQISPLALQIFNLLLHLLGALLLFYWLNDVSSFNRQGWIWAISIYLLSPVTLWFHGNGYTHHVIIEIIILAIGVTMHVISKQQINSRKRFISLCLLGIISIFGILTEYMLLFFFLVGCFISIKFKSSQIRKNLLIIGIGITLGLGILITLLLNHMGLDQTIDYLTNRLIHRSFLDTESSTWLTWFIKLTKWYAVGFGVWLIPLVIACKRFKQKKIIDHAYPKDLLVFFMITITIASILYKVIFKQFAFEHDYVVLIDCIPFALMLTFQGIDNLKKTLYIFCFFGSVIQYYMINRPGSISQRGDRYDQFLKAGERIQKTSRPEEVIFTLGNSYNFPANNPQLMFYSKRNICAVKSMKEAQIKLNELGIQHGIIYKLSSNKIVYYIKFQRNYPILN